MVEKRKRSSAATPNTTHVRSQPAAKRQQSSTPAPPQNQPATPPPKLPDLPTSFDRNGPLPVLPEPQPNDLQLRDFRSVAESKVLQEALARSTRKWVDGDIFEKYWTKPLKSRKLDPAIIEKNPGKDTMVKLGNATMHIVPHKFDIRLFQLLRPVKEPPLLPPPLPAAAAAYAPPPSHKQQQPLRAPQLPPQQSSAAPVQNPPPAQRSHTQPGPKVQNAQPLAPPATMRQQQPSNAASQAKMPPSQPQQQPAAPMRSAPQPAAQGPGPPQQMPNQGLPRVPSTQNAPPRPPQQPGQPVHRPPQQQALPQQGPPQQQGLPQHPQAPPRPDPVIQMLAMKASTDVKLKELMRIVASGNATGDQLQEFQGYIDTLTAASNTNPLDDQFRQPPPPPPSAPRQLPQQAHPQQQPLQQQFRGQPQPQHAAQPMPAQMHPTQLQQQQQHMYQHSNPQTTMRPYQQQHQQLPPPVQQQQQQHKQQQRPPAQPKSRTFPQAPKQEICGIVFEFIDSYSQGDRFRFPKHAILEYQNRGTTVITSFIVTRTPEGHEQGFYQPVTIVLESAYPRILDHLKLVVADPETTRKHMQQIMATKKRANDAFLLYRLRREPGEAVPDRAYVETRMDPPSRHGRGGGGGGGGGGGANAKEAGTPMRDNKSGGNSMYPRTGPKVKHVKKHSVSNPESVTVASNGSPASAPPVAASSVSASCSAAAVSTSAAPGSGRNPSVLPVDFSPPAEPKPPRQPKPPRSRKGRIADPTKNCRICQTSKTSLWRKADIEGENATVCNACGIKWKTNAQKQVQIAAAIAQGLPIPVFPGDEVARRSSSGGGLRPSLDSEAGGSGGGGSGLLWMDEEGVESVTGQVFATASTTSTAASASAASASSAIPAAAIAAVPAVPASPAVGTGPPEPHSILRAVASVRSPASSPSPPRLQSQSHSILRAVASVPSAQPTPSLPKPMETEAVLR